MNEQFATRTLATALSVHLNIQMIMGACAWVPPPNLIDWMSRVWNRIWK